MCIVNLSFMTWPLTRHKSNDKIHQIHPPQRSMLRSTTLNLWTLLLHPAIERRKRSLSKLAWRIPFFITNLSSSSRVVLQKDHIMAFITPEDPETNYVEIAEVQSVEGECRNWKHPTKMLPKAPESDFLVSPCDIKEVRMYAARKWYHWWNSQILLPTSWQISGSLFHQ